MKDGIPNRPYWKRFIAKYIWRYNRFFLFHTRFGRKKLKYWLMTRKEKDTPLCTDCGLCCANCICYEKTTKKCKIWNFAKNILHCDFFPLTPWDLYFDATEGICRYYWEKN